MRSDSLVQECRKLGLKLKIRATEARSMTRLGKPGPKYGFSKVTFWINVEDKYGKLYCSEHTVLADQGTSKLSWGQMGMLHVRQKAWTCIEAAKIHHEYMVKMEELKQPYQGLYGRG